MSPDEGSVPTATIHGASSRRPDGLSRPTEALRLFGITGARVRRIQSGLVSWHWDVSRQGERLVLRRYNPWRFDVAYEHRVLARLRDRGWPVAAPISAREGETVVDVGGETYALFPRLLGRPRTHITPDVARDHGKLLAALHADLESLVPLGQRDRMEMMHRYATQPLSPNGRTFEDVLPAFVTARPDLGKPLARHHERLTPALARLNELPTTVIHGDFSRWNLLYLEERLTGILDFDFTRLDLRMADIAINSRFEGDPSVWSSFVSGYFSQAPLSDDEGEAFVPLRMARGLTHAANALGWWETGRDDMLGEIERGVRELDRDEASESELMRTFDAATR